VEDQEDRFVLLCSDSVLYVLLVLSEKLGVKFNVTGLVHAVDVSESGSDGEIWRDGGKRIVNGKDVLGLGVKRVIINILIIDTILLTTSNANFLVKRLKNYL
jgi:hypothetical protein